MNNSIDSIKTLSLLSETLSDRIESLSALNLKRDRFNSGQFVAYKTCSDLLSMRNMAPSQDTRLRSSLDSRDNPDDPPAVSEETLSEALLILSIRELLSRLGKPARIKSQFDFGLRTAYVECLEIIQFWDKARLFGLDFDIEEVYPLM